MVATETPSPWTDAEWAAALISLLGEAVGGVHLRSPPGPVRDYWLERVKQLSKQDPIRKIPANIPEGPTAWAVLISARPCSTAGLSLKPACWANVTGTLSSLRWLSAYLAAPCIILCTALDHGALSVARDGIEAETPARIALIANDEGTEKRVPTQP
jgi:magnesium chelatase subunit D